MKDSSNFAIEVKNLKKSYKDLEVLKDLNLHVNAGNIFALLGPNGAGKTTAVKILSTLLKADGGVARVNGFDVDTQDVEVRSNIGLTGQYAAVDEYLTARENLVMIGRLYRMDRKAAQDQAKSLLKRFELTDAADRQVRTYSGGMRRRLDLAMSLISSPSVIFLDEPTTGLDPPSRLALWEMIEELADQGTTVLLTTQYMDEADRLADWIAVLDTGRIIAEGTATQLKAQIGSERVVLTMADEENLEAARKLFKSSDAQIDNEERTISIASKQGIKTLKKTLDKVSEANLKATNVSLRQPTLDDVFLKLTGHSTEKNDADKKKGKK